MNLERISTHDLMDSSVTTCYVKCRCEICKKEFMGFAGSVVCSESRCNREWMDKNIHSKLELAQALQQKATVTSNENQQQEIEMTAIYDTDFYTWTQQQVVLLKLGRFADIDLENIIEEIESMGRSEKRELESRLTVLLQHLLKWQYQPARRGKSWELTIKAQRIDFLKVLRDNPGLKSKLSGILLDAYQLAVVKASQETGLDESIFPSNCPWSFEKISNFLFYPE